MFPLETNFEGFHDNWEWEHHYVWVGDQWLFKPERFLVGKCGWFYSHEIHSALTAEERSWLFLALETISPRTKTCTTQEIVSGFKFQANQTNSEHLYCVSRDHREVWGAAPDPDTEKWKRCSQRANRLCRPKSSSRCFSVREGAIQTLGQTNQKHELTWQISWVWRPDRCFRYKGAWFQSHLHPHTHWCSQALQLSVSLRLWAQAAAMNRVKE